MTPCPQAIKSARIYRLRRQGLSGSQIGKLEHLSRNAVIGRGVRQEQQIEKDNRDLRILDAIADGEDPRGIAAREDVPLRHIKILIKESKDGSWE